MNAKRQLDHKNPSPNEPQLLTQSMIATANTDWISNATNDAHN